MRFQICTFILAFTFIQYTEALMCHDCNMGVTSECMNPQNYPRKRYIRSCTNTCMVLKGDYGDYYFPYDGYARLTRNCTNRFCTTRWKICCTCDWDFCNWENTCGATGNMLTTNLFIIVFFVVFIVLICA